MSKCGIRNDVGVGNNEKISELNKYKFTEKDKSELTPIAKREESEEENKSNDETKSRAGVLKWWAATQKWVVEPEFLTLSSMRVPKFRHWR